MAFDPKLGPFIYPRPPRQFRPILPVPPPQAPSGDISSLVPPPPGRVEVPSAFDPSQQVPGRFEMTSPEERTDLQGTRNRFNVSSALRSLQNAAPGAQPSFRRPTEELYR